MYARAAASIANVNSMGTIIAAMTPDERRGPEEAFRLLGGRPLELADGELCELLGSTFSVGVGRWRSKPNAVEDAVGVAAVMDS